MTFINPALLPALALSALPVLIHLFSRQRRRDIDFSTLKFLKLLERKRMRRVRIAEWLLLALRTLAVFFIALSFTRPALRQDSGVFKGESSTAAYVIVDNSIASQLQTPRGEASTLELNEAGEALKLFGAKDNVVITTASEPAGQINKEPLPGGDNRLRKTIFEIASTEAAPDWKTALNGAAWFFEKTNSPNKEIHIFSAFKQNTGQLDSAEAGMAGNVRIFHYPVESVSGEDIAITDIVRETQIVQAGSPVEFTVKLRNHGTEAVTGIPISLFMGNERAAAEEISIPVEAETSVKMKAVPKTAGKISGSVKIEWEDALSADNTRWFSFYVPQTVEVYILGDAEDAEILKTALKPGEGFTVEPHVLQSAGEIGGLPEEAVIVIAGDKFVSTYATGILKRRLGEGSGVIILPSEHTDAGKFNRELLGPLGLPLFREIDYAREGTMWGNMDAGHPLFSGVFAEKAEIESPRVYRYFKLAGSGGAEIIGFPMGTSFLREIKLGAGRVLLFTSGAGDFWSDFRRKPIFAPLFYRSVIYLSAGSNNKETAVTAGNPIIFYPAGIVSGLKMAKPDGISAEIAPKTGNNTIEILFTETGKAGIYQLYSGGVLTEIFPANPAVDFDLQSEYKPVSHNVRTLSQDEEIVEFVRSARLGKELWKWFLTAGLLFLFSEMILVRMMK